MNNNSRKENIGIYYLSLICCCDSPYLQPFLLTNEKTPALDGSVYLYSKDLPLDKNGYETDYIERIIPVQVKTTESKKKLGNTIKYQVYKDDADVFYKSGGALFFVVAIDECSNKVIYYYELSPVNLQHILNEMSKDNTKSKSLEFRRVTGNIEHVFRSFSKSLSKQTSFYNGDLVVYDNLDDLDSNVEKLDFSFELLNDKFIKAEVMMKKKGERVPFPFSYKVSNEIMTNLRLTRTIHFGLKNGQSYTVELTNSLLELMSKSGFHNRFELSKNLSIIFNNKSLTLNFNPVGSVKSILEDLNFLYTLSIDKVLKIENFSVPFKLDLKIIEKFKAGIEFYSLLYSFLSCKLDYKKFINVDMSEIDSGIVALFFELKEKVNSLNGDVGIYLLNQVLDSSIVRVKKDGYFQYYYIFDFLISYQKMFTVNSDGSKSDIIYNYFMLFYAFDNISVFGNCIKQLSVDDKNKIIEILKASLKGNETDVLSYYVNNIIDVLKYIDILDDFSEKESMLSFVSEINKIVGSSNKKDSIEYIYNYINELQIYKRLRCLSNKEIGNLKNLLLSCQDTFAILAMNILLENWDSVKDMYKVLPDEAVKEFNNWPIFNLIPKDVLN